LVRKPTASAGTVTVAALRSVTPDRIRIADWFAQRLLRASERLGRMS
jgi:hypothetical protein